jgi:aspartyl/asparaginyl beta-hydroxylase (cupin superfamily)
MQLTNQDAEKLIRAGVDALQQGRAADARDRFAQVTATGRANAQGWLLLAAACHGAGDITGQEAAVDQLLKLEPRAIRGHIMKADCRAATGDDIGALTFYTSALLAAKDERLPGDLAAEVQRADNAAVTLKARFEVEREALFAARGLPAATRSPRFQQSLDILAGRKRVFVQEPTGYYFPGLPQIQYFDPADFAWAPAIEAATDAIRAEIAPILAAGAGGFRPYIQADPNRPRLDDNQLADSKDWSALFVVENGRESPDVIARCPATWAALQGAPMPRIANSPTAMFSLLRPGARITPHTGTHNTRLVCHLPLIVPPNCRFRVGNEVRDWEEGKLLIFDDTIEHEAWNDSNEDRILLIFDIWRPELSDQEQREIDALFSGPTMSA